MVETNGPQATADADSLNGTTEQAALNRQREFAEGFYLYEDSFGRGGEVLGLEAIEFFGPVLFFGLGPGSGGGQDFREGRVELGQIREDSFPDAVSLVIFVRVGAVFPPGEVAGGQVVADFVSSQGEEGTDDLICGCRANSAEAGGSGTAQETEEHGFGLVVQCVACRYGIADVFRDALREESVAVAAGFLLGVAFGRRKGGDVEGEVEFVREFMDEGFVGV